MSSRTVSSATTVADAGLWPDYTILPLTGSPLWRGARSNGLAVLAITPSSSPTSTSNDGILLMGSSYSAPQMTQSASATTSRPSYSLRLTRNSTFVLIAPSRLSTPTFNSLPYPTVNLPSAPRSLSAITSRTPPTNASTANNTASASPATCQAGTDCA